MLRSIHIGGKLGAEFGAEFRLDVATPAEAIHALCIQLPGFRDRVFSGSYSVALTDDMDGPILDCEQLSLNVGKSDIYIVPAIEGRGFVLPFIAMLLPAGFSFGTLIINSLINIGISLALAGVASLLSPKPSTQSSTISDAAEKEIDVFSSSQNVSTQGIAIPLIYGETMVGSNVISIGISAATKSI